MASLGRAAIRLESTLVAAGTTFPPATAPGWDVREFTMFRLVLPGTVSSATVTFTESDTENGTYQPVYDQDNAAVSVTVAASRTYDLPPALASCHFLRVVGASSEAAGRRLVLLCKS
jgi:hypothetical protein